MTMDWNDQVWVINHLNGNLSKVASLEEGLLLASRIVGNDSYAQAVPGSYLFGPGDGTTSIIVQKLPRFMVDRQTTEKEKENP